MNGTGLKMAAGAGFRPLALAAIGAAGAVCMAILLGLTTAPAYGYGGINSFEVSPSSTQAGGHPDIHMEASFDNNVVNGGGNEKSPLAEECECQDPAEITVKFPTGFIGSPNAVPRCTLLLLSERNCPPESQIGAVGQILLANITLPLYNMEPHPEEPGLSAFFAPIINAPVFIQLSARTDSDYGLNATTPGIFHLLPIAAMEINLWGVPGDPVHDVNRFPAPQQGFGGCPVRYPTPCEPPTPFNAPVRPFLESPTACGDPLSAGLEIRYYDFTTVSAEAPWPATTGCDQLSFNPSLTAKPTTTQADSPTGLDVDLRVPQTQSPTTPSPSEIRATTVTLPPGFSINPNAADGKTSCTDQQGSFGTLKAAECPEHAKVGTLVLDSTALPAPIDGAIYLGAPQPGNRYRLFLAADGFSTHVKLAGSVHLDPATGQIVVSFDDLPQSPFQRFTMHFFGSERGLLATPTQCGVYSVHTTFVPWNSVLPNQTSTAEFTIDSGPGGDPCPGSPRSFTPELKAGSANNTAGAHSSFTLKVSRPDGNQNLSAVNVTAPPGFSAVLSGVPYCSEAAISKLSNPGHGGRVEQTSPACPATSQIGNATAVSGAGTRPLTSPGKVYLAGPYRGAPLSLVVVVPAVSGPYDLGNVAVRSAIHVNATTAQVSTASDPIPTIVEGIPLRLRSIQVDLDRPAFALNPTNCSPLSVGSRLLGTEGGIFDVRPHYQVANCTSLDFSPRINLTLRGSTKRRGNPALRVVLRPDSGDANLGRIVTVMPKTLLLDNSHIGTVCTRVQFASETCPAGSTIGSATVQTPLLDQPLSGNVYLRSSSRRLPDLVIALRGQFDIDLVGRIDTSKAGGLRTTFAAIPDAPFSRAVIDLQGGGKGLLVNSVNLCRRPPAAAVRFFGQNGMRLDRRMRLRTGCRAKRKNVKHVRRLSRARVAR